MPLDATAFAGVFGEGGINSPGVSLMNLMGLLTDTLSNLVSGWLATSPEWVSGLICDGVLGGIFATLGMITPSIIIVGIIAAFISGFQDYEVVQWAFSGIRAAVVALILSAMWKIAKKSIVDIFAFIIFLAVAILSYFTDLSPVIFVIAAGVCGLVINSAGLRKAKEEKKK